MEIETLVTPTVEQLIEALRQLDPKATIIIEDADTCWTIDRIHLRIDTTGRVVLFGEYCEMV